MRLELDSNNNDSTSQKKTDSTDSFTPVRDEKPTLKGEIAKIKSLGRKDGWNYFWEYYHMPIIIIIIVSAIAISITVSVVRNSRPFIIDVMVYNNYLNNDADVSVLEEEFADYVGKNTRDYQITFDFSEYIDFANVDESSYASMMKVSAMISASSLDVFGGSQEFIDYYSAGDEDSAYFYDLEDVLSSQFFKYLDEQGLIYYCNYTDDDGNVTGKYAAAVNAANTRIVNDEYMQISPCYLGIAGNTTRLETCVDFLEWIFDYQN